MSFKSTTQPLCRCCGKPIRKHTRAIFFGRSAARVDDHWEDRTEHPRDRAEAQRLTNQQIVSLSWFRAPYDFIDGKADYVDKVTIWDGESYYDEFFCTGSCAQVFGRIMAKNGHATKAFMKARNEQINKQRETQS